MKTLEAIRYTLGLVLIIAAGAVACSSTVLNHKFVAAKESKEITYK